MSYPKDICFKVVEASEGLFFEDVLTDECNDLVRGGHEILDIKFSASNRTEQDDLDYEKKLFSALIIYR